MSPVDSDLRRWVEEKFVALCQDDPAVSKQWKEHGNIGKGPLKTYLLSQLKGGSAPSHASQTKVTKAVNVMFDEHCFTRKWMLEIRQRVKETNTAQRPASSEAAPHQNGTNSHSDTLRMEMATPVIPSQKAAEPITSKPYEFQLFQEFKPASKSTDGPLIIKSSTTERQPSKVDPGTLVNLLKNGVDNHMADKFTGKRISSAAMPALDDQMNLLSLTNSNSNVDPRQVSDKDINNAVLFGAKVKEVGEESLFPQYGLLGSAEKQLYEIASSDPRVFHNTNVPFSTFICGLQGSGKSHTLSCLLENCLVQSPNLGRLEQPLSALVFHFGQFVSHSTFHPCEAAYLASPNPAVPSSTAAVSSVTVLVAPSNFFKLNAAYKGIPGVKVKPLRFDPKKLTITTIISLMAVDQSQGVPLYMEQVFQILRDMAANSAGPFDYLEFRRRLGLLHMLPAQTGPMMQRLSLLDCFLDQDPRGPVTDLGLDLPGLTIVDLSCPFIDAAMACTLFQNVLDLFLGTDSRSGKVIVADEAHKFMTNTPASKQLTESLVTVIRQQRHYGARVIISTQEPTVSPQLIALCSLVVVHRFSSPSWLSVLKQHIAVEGDRYTADELLKKFLSLKTGQALIFAPNAVRAKDDGKTELLGSNLWKVNIRKRITFDGGQSIVCATI